MPTDDGTDTCIMGNGLFCNVNHEVLCWNLALSSPVSTQTVLQRKPAGAAH
jgi:hypothetical protein